MMSGVSSNPTAHAMPYLQHVQPQQPQQQYPEKHHHRRHRNHTPNASSMHPSNLTSHMNDRELLLMYAGSRRLFGDCSPTSGDLDLDDNNNINNDCTRATTGQAAEKPLNPRGVANRHRGHPPTATPTPTLSWPPHMGHVNAGKGEVDAMQAIASTTTTTTSTRTATATTATATSTMDTTFSSPASSRLLSLESLEDSAANPFPASSPGAPGALGGHSDDLGTLPSRPRPRIRQSEVRFSSAHSNPTTELDLNPPPASDQQIDYYPYPNQNQDHLSQRPSSPYRRQPAAALRDRANRPPPRHCWCWRLFAVVLPLCVQRLLRRIARTPAAWKVWLARSKAREDEGVRRRGKQGSGRWRWLVQCGRKSEDGSVRRIRVDVPGSKSA